MRVINFLWLPKILLSSSLFFVLVIFFRQIGVLEVLVPYHSRLFPGLLNHEWDALSLGI